MKLYILSALLFSTVSIMSGSDLGDLKQRFIENNYYGSKVGRSSLLEIAAGDYGEAAVVFLEEIYHGPPETRGSLHSRFPEANLKLNQEMRGVAQAGLITLGNKDAKDALLAESLSEEKFFRYNALQKAKMVEGDIGVELLSYFIGDIADHDEKPVVGWLEQPAVIELCQRVKNPPYYVGMHDLKSLQGYEEGRKAWLKWRYKNYGPIPGREELFTQFAASSGEGNPATPSARVVESVEENTAPEPAIEEPTKVVVAEPIEEDVERSSNWWLWLIGVVVVVGGIGLAARRKN